MDRLPKSNTSKSARIRCFEGCMLYELIPNVPEHHLVPLIGKFAEAMSNVGAFTRAIPASK
ncbi:MAG: hypothetical protein JOY65_08240 [Acetobacteraceae bacterium]|nr:hypothetical protein [Acetobacteraceae bacterium]